jgi:hypothetical protein
VTVTAEPAAAEAPKPAMAPTPEAQKPAVEAPAAAQPSAATAALFSVGMEAPDGSTTPPAEAKPAVEAAKKPSVSELAARFKSGMPSF